jgi:hypothetical protein
MYRDRKNVLPNLISLLINSLATINVQKQENVLPNLISLLSNSLATINVQKPEKCVAKPHVSALQLSRYDICRDRKNVLPNLVFLPSSSLATISVQKPEERVAKLHSSYLPSKSVCTALRSHLTFICLLSLATNSFRTVM